MDPISFAVSATTSATMLEIVTKYLKKKSGKVTEADPEVKTYEHVIDPAFGSYVTRNIEFKDELISLRDTVANYATRQSVKRPLNVLLAAEPGSGKSFLVKQLAKSLPQKVKFEEFYVAAFRNVEDLIGVFQRVQSANLEGVLPLVLFDEVDGKVAGRHVLSNFLAPMWDGIFHSGKDSFTLGKSVFLFAGSNIIPSPSVATVLEDENPPGPVSYHEFAEKWNELTKQRIEKMVDDHNGIEKCKDFIDRVDIMLCIPPVHNALSGDQAGLELIDIACLLIKKHFENVKLVEESALMSLVNMLRVATSRRPAEKAIFCSNLHTASKFRFSDLPAKDQRRNQGKQEVDEGMGKFMKIIIKKSSPK